MERGGPRYHHGVCHYPGPNLGEIASVAHPDGTMSYFQYSTDTNGVATTSECVGEPDGQGGILNGRQIVTQTDAIGRVLSRTITAIQEGTASIVLSQETRQYAATGQDYTVTDALANLSTSYHYDCCGLATVTDPEGVLTAYDYDALHRQVASQVLRGGASGVKTTNVLDAAGQVW